MTRAAILGAPSKEGCIIITAAFKGFATTAESDLIDRRTAANR